MAIEECAELIHQLCKYRREGENESRTNLILYEMVDVRVMLEQLQLLLDISDADLDYHMGRKLERLRKRLEDQ